MQIPKITMNLQVLSWLSMILVPDAGVIHYDTPDPQNLSIFNEKVHINLELVMILLDMLTFLSISHRKFSKKYASSFAHHKSLLFVWKDNSCFFEFHLNFFVMKGLPTNSIVSMNR